MNNKRTSSPVYFLKDINPVIRFLIVSDTIVFGASGLLGPIFALFIQDFIVGSNEAVVGLAAGIYLFTKSILQIPIANLIDKIKGERDDFTFMFICMIAISFIPALYLIINTPFQLYLVQFCLGVFSAATFPTFMAIFTRHIDTKKEGTEWGLYYTLTDLTGALFAALGGFLATMIGFQYLILFVVVMSLFGSFFLFPIRQYLK